MDSRTKLLAGLALAMGTGLIYLSHRNAVRPVIGPNDRVLVAGDSLGVGLQGRLQKLAAAEGIALDGVSVGGTAIFQWARQDSSVAGQRVGIVPILSMSPTVVLLSLGTNDGGMSADSIEGESDDLERFIEALFAHRIKIVWILPPAEVAVPRAAPVLDMITNSPAARRCGAVFLRPPNGVLDGSGDGIHPRGAGYDLWATNIWQKVRGK